jgi:predicted nucleotidyltransferase
MKLLAPQEGKRGALIFTETMKELLGEALCMTALYGSITRDDFNILTSDVNLLVVCSSLEVGASTRIYSQVQNAKEDYKISPLYMESRELHRYADLFPVRFFEIKRSYQVLQGTDLLADISVNWDRIHERICSELLLICGELRHALLIGLPSTFLLAKSLRKIMPHFTNAMRTLAASPLEAGEEAKEYMRISQEKKDSIVETASLKEIEEVFDFLFKKSERIMSLPDEKPAH